ncbi:unnamed protein product [Symbiodinium natans]|uniref:DUF4116 domain-containing protein n=1 Tax=Symbiodinium natans TaxID=878477 RepID=A0A812Q614_9DINO|nr:unnamed protein product [Symbiodinium natans]
MLTLANQVLETILETIVSSFKHCEADALTGAWTGYYFLSLERHDVGQFNLEFGENGLVRGEGLDKEGAAYTLSGKLDRTLQVISFEKKSGEGQAVQYRGRLVDSNGGFRGTWWREGVGGVFHFWPARRAVKKAYDKSPSQRSQKSTEETAPPTCLNGHDLQTLDINRDTHWHCHGAELEGGCKRGISDLYQTTGMHHRCEVCKFDLCDRCFEARRVAAGRRRTPNLNADKLDFWYRQLRGAPFSFAAVLPGHPQVVLAAVKLHGYALEYASEELKNDREFLLEAVRETKASWLAHFASESLREDPSFRAECSQAAGTGLVFTYYESYDCLDYMRTCFPTAAASVPGGQAYAEVMEKMKVREGSTATVWFDQQLVFGHTADSGKWLHPNRDCGRDRVPVPPADGRDAKWASVVESRNHRRIPEVGERFPCWCCHWLRLVRQRHAEGCVICCTVSNIFSHSWVERFGAGSSELSDAVAEELGLPPERFQNGRPASWGEGRIQVSDGKSFERRAPLHPHTGLPLGNGCRWERSVLDQLEFPVYVFFMP